MPSKPPIPFDNSYARLPGRFYSPQDLTPVSAPSLVILNDTLAGELKIAPDWLRGPDGVNTLSGNDIPAGATPISQAYAGHQFGGWVPQLGDGRAVLLGEVIDKNGQRRDMTLKGSGRTPYSRGGDGRAWLGPVLREYVVSEAMHALGVPTTRALAAVATGDPVDRGEPFPGAVLTRVAASHIRVGTFQYFAAKQDTEALKILCDHVIKRHYPGAKSPLDLLYGVISRQAALVAKWMSFGFVHGVMNTDNMTISGETIDYGPCAFMDQYHPGTVFSSIDHQGRYGFSNQPAAAAWNLAQLANSLLPLMGDQDAAIRHATAAIDGFTQQFDDHWLTLFAHKIGIASPRDDDRQLIKRFLDGLEQGEADFTNGFRGLLQGDVPDNLTDWKADWQARLAEQDRDPQTLMRAANPAYIPRNHRVEAMIGAAIQGDFAPLERIMGILAQPFDDQPDALEFRNLPTVNEMVLQTYCGT